MFSRLIGNKAFVDEFTKAYKRCLKATALSGHVAAQFIAEGFKKAGKVDKEALIRIVGGMTFESPVGPLTLRACDHQLELPTHFGATKKDAKYPFLASVDDGIMPPKDCMPTCEEVLKHRKK